MRNNDNYPDFLVGVRCMTYNHHAYIEDAMNGFTMQQTTFPFVCVIIDDASTDGEPDVILRYMKDHFDLAPESGARQWETDEARFLYARHRQNPNCYFGIVLLKTNNYSQHKSKEHLMTQWLSDVKYIALCEGDDYWTDPNKLQIQTEFLENHPDYSMCWHDGVIISASDGNIIGNHRRYLKDTVCKVEEIIQGGGAFIPSASILYNREIKNNIPQELFNQVVGDYPLQLSMALSGKVYYMDKEMSVYRIGGQGSWTSTIYQNHEKKRMLLKGEFKIYNDFDSFSQYKYHESFQRCKISYLYEYYWSVGNYSKARKFLYKLGLKRVLGTSLRRILYLHGYAHIRKFIPMK